MGERRPHHKTRTGCTTCKKRRIKCDEKKPRCHNCSRRDLQCSFQSTTPAYLDRTSSRPRSPRGHPPSAGFDATSSNSPSTVANDSPNASLLNPQAPPTSELAYTLRDLELLFYYSTVTMKTLVVMPAHACLWQEQVPKLAFEHDFLMRGVFTVAATHKAHMAFKDGRESDMNAHLDDAAFHINSALSGFRTAIRHISPENCGALLALTSFVSVYVFATSTCGNKNDSFDGTKFTQGLGLIRAGMKAIIPVVHWIKESPMGALIPRKGWIEHPNPTTDEQKATDAKLGSLQAFWGKESQFGIFFSEKQVESLNYALDKLRTSFLRVSYIEQRLKQVTNNTSREETEEGWFTKDAIIMSWLDSLDDTFMEMWQNRSPAASLLLAYFAVMMSKIDHLWWIEDFPTQLLRSSIAGFHGQLHWLEWPMEKLGFSQNEIPNT